MSSLVYSFVVSHGGGAAAAGLTDLDQILSVNGVVVDSLTHDVCVCVCVFEFSEFSECVSLCTS